MSGIKNANMNDNGTFKSDTQLAHEADMSEYFKLLKQDKGYDEWLDKLENEDERD